MPITLRTTEMAYRDNSGQYVGINGVSERTTAEQIAAVEAAGEHVLEDVIPHDWTELTEDFDDIKEKIVMSSTTEPDEENNRIWLKPMASETAIPTYEEFSELKSALTHNITIANWENGVFNGKTGVKATATNRIRTNAPLPKSTECIVPDTGYEFAVLAFNGEPTTSNYAGVYDGTSVSKQNAIWYTTSVNVGNVGSLYSLYLMVKKTVDADMTSSDGSHIKLSCLKTDSTLTMKYIPADAEAVGDKFEDLDANIDAITESITEVKPLDIWEQGAISSSTGENVSADNRIRTEEHLTRSIVSIIPVDGYEYAVLCYDGNDDYVGVYDGSQVVQYSAIWFSNVAYINNVTKTYNVRLMVRASDNSDISYTDSDDMISFRVVSVDTDDTSSIQELRAGILSKISKPINVQTGKFMRVDSNGEAAWEDGATSEEIAEAVTDWLDDNIPSGQTVVIDKTLTVSNAAADAKVVGDNLYAIQKRLLKAENIVIVAASDSSANNKAIADYICDGETDEVTLYTAVNSLTKGGTVYLLDGNYYINSFTHFNNDNTEATAIYLESTGTPRVINIIGLVTEAKGYSAENGANIRITDSVMQTLDNDTIYNVFASTHLKYNTYGFNAPYNNLNIENVHIYLNDASKKVVGINGTKCGSMYLKFVGVYTKNYFQERYSHSAITTPKTGSIGVVSPSSSNDESAKLGMDWVSVGGLNVGFKIAGVDRMTMRECAASRCNYGYLFVGNLSKTLNMICCADEGNTHLPKFSGTGHLTCLDFNIERFNSSHIPIDESGNTELYATEESIGGWHGQITYTLQGANMGMYTFWKQGNYDGCNFESVNLDNRIFGMTQSRPSHPDLCARYYDRSLSKMMIYNGSEWV